MGNSGLNWEMKQGPQKPHHDTLHQDKMLADLYIHLHLCFKQFVALQWNHFHLLCKNHFVASHEEKGTGGQGFPAEGKGKVGALKAEALKDKRNYFTLLS